MKAWMKGAILGGIWGLISLIGALIPGLSGHPYEVPFIDKFIFAPAFISFYIFVEALKTVGTYLIFLAYIFPIIIGALLGTVIGYLFQKRRKGNLKILNIFLLLLLFSLIGFYPVHAYAPHHTNQTQEQSNGSIGILSANEPIYREMIACPCVSNRLSKRCRYMF